MIQETEIFCWMNQEMERKAPQRMNQEMERKVPQKMNQETEKKILQRTNQKAERKNRNDIGFAEYI